MNYKVEVTSLAKQDTRDYAHFIRDQRAPEAAIRWLNDLQEGIASLASMPERFAKIAESDRLRTEYRQFMYFSHRVVYRIEEELKTVYIIRVYHGARNSLMDLDLE